MISHKISGLADNASARYATLVGGWRSLYDRALDQGNFGSAQMFAQVEREAYGLAHRYLEVERQHIAAFLEEIALEAQGATFSQLSVDDADELTDAVSAHLSEAESYLASEISIQIERDIAFLRLSLRRAVLQVNLAARAQGITTRTALLQYRIGNAQELQFSFHDRGNTKWPSRKFIRTVWRHALLAAYNEAVLLTLSDHGLDQAEIAHDDAKAGVHGMRIAMGANSTLPTYAEIREEIFHPNANAILRKAA